MWSVNKGRRVGVRVPVPETVNLLIGMLKGVLRQRGLRLEEISGMRDVTVGFCKRSLVRG
jgi:hypothetical protein